MSFVYERPRASTADTFAGGEASLGDIYSAAVDQMLYVDNTYATNWAMDRAITERNDEVFAATGVRPSHPFRRSYIDAAREARKQGMTPSEAMASDIAAWQREISTAAARIPDQNVANGLNRSVEADAIRIARESDQNLSSLMGSRGGLGKWLAAFGGGMSGSMRDPLAIGSLFIGGGPGAGRTIAGRILSAAAREAFVNGATEAAMQPMVQAWREKAGLDHGLEEALANIGFAAAFGGVLGGAGHAIGEGAAKLSGRALDVAGAAAALDPKTSEPLRRTMAGDIAAARETLPEIRSALPAQARGALDHTEIVGHLDSVRPRTAEPEIHDINVSAAHRSIDIGEPARFTVDDAQIQRIAQSIVGEQPDSAVPSAPSLVEFLSERGIIDHQGELATIGAADLARKRRGKVDRRLPLDMAREAAEEAGYIGRAGETQVTTIADLLDAIDREKRGQKIYPRGDEPIESTAAEASRAGVERTVADIASYAGPAVDDRIIREAAELAIGDGLDPFDALESVLIRAEPEIRASETGQTSPLPGWSDAELEAASAGRGPEPGSEKTIFSNPADEDPELSISPADVEQYAGLEIPADNGRVVSLSEYMDQVKADEDLAALVKACRA